MGLLRGTPFVAETVKISKQEYIQLKAEAAFYKAQHERSVKREEQLKRQIEKQKAQVLDLQQRLYGRRSEKSKGSSKKPAPDCARGVRGQRDGSPSHGRTPLPNLPVVERVIDVDEDKKTCPECQSEIPIAARKCAFCTSAVA